MKKEALAADPGNQKSSGMGGPIKAYWDQQRGCEYCGHDFTFSADEQRFWYEIRGFFVESYPIGCPACRKKLRQKKQAQKELMSQLPLAKNASWKEWEAISQVQLAAGSSAKAIDYLRRAKNQCGEPEERQRLTTTIEALMTAGACNTLERKGWGRNDLVEQLLMHYDRNSRWGLDYAERQAALAEPGIDPKTAVLVARIQGTWIHPEPDTQDNQRLAFLNGKFIHPNTGSRQAKVLIDTDTNVLLWLPDSGRSGRTGHHRSGDAIFGPPGPLPWLE